MELWEVVTRLPDGWSANRNLAVNGFLPDYRNAGVGSGVRWNDQSKQGLAYAGVWQIYHVVEMARHDPSGHARCIPESRFSSCRSASVSQAVVNFRTRLIGCLLTIYG
jgi:hypothetical protein